MEHKPNADHRTVEGFGREWQTFTQERIDASEREELFRRYFSLIDWAHVNRALDMGCGSGRWDVLVAPRVPELVLADASGVALEVAKRNVCGGNVQFVQCTPESVPFPDSYFDLIFSLGVLHHVPDTAAAIAALTKKLAPGGTMLLYLYYALDHRPAWHRMLWRLTDMARRIVCRLPFPLRRTIAEAVALCIYWPLARLARLLPVGPSWPLRFYANRSLYVMRTDALDRLGTRLERRFSRRQIEQMLLGAGLQQIRFSEKEPYWVCTAKNLVEQNSSAG